MSVHQLTIDILCDIPSWIQLHPDIEFRNTFYRLYLDQDLLTERTWDFGNHVYVREHMWITSTSGQEHTFRLTPIVKSKTQAKFSLRNFMIDKKEHILYPTDLEITFKV